jgi:tetratricopeptide (TPR) repeat protein
VAGAVRVIAVALIAYAGPLRAHAILPPDAAVKAYQAGQAAAQKKDWPLVVRKMNEALATGHTQAQKGFGTTRNFVDLYDPYYWLGVAHMELGEVLEARRNLLKSRSEGVIDGFPESADLLGRLGQLDRREAQQAADLPTPTAAPTLEPTAVATASAVPTAVPLGREDAAAAPKDAAGTDPERILTLFSAGDFAGAEAAIESFRRTRPDAREADLLATLVLGTRYVLEGRDNPALLARAKKALSSWRKRGGGRRSEEALLSPSLLAALNGG